VGAPPEITDPAPVATTDAGVAALLTYVRDEVLDPGTGLPTRASGVAPADALGGQFKLMTAFLAAGHPVPFARAAVDSVLAMRLPDGGFSALPNLTLEWDALWVLDQLDRQLARGHRFSEIRAAGEDVAQKILARHRQRDGAFAGRGDVCATSHHSIFLSEPLPESDTGGTVMALRCLAFADRWSSSSASAL
jgi:hypothetical protein